MNLVKELRLRAGMSQKELSIEAHVSRATISDWESQKKDPKKKENIDRLAEIFNVRAHDLKPRALSCSSSSSMAIEYQFSD